tara:strand:+ start:1366 stop:1797 length:432 start_codon:yes stop_codon:yes gene_type:complete
MNILVINGPNLNLLGFREPNIYGKNTLNELMSTLEKNVIDLNHNIKIFQSNHEGNLIDIIHDQKDWADGILINPAAFTHYSYAIRDAIQAVKIPTIEVHISDINNRENFRKKSVIREVCIDCVTGLGEQSYNVALEKLIKVRL